MSGVYSESNFLGFGISLRSLLEFAAVSVSDAIKEGSTCAGSSTSGQSSSF